MSPRCFLDMDGVIAAFIRGACAFYDKDYDALYGQGAVSYDCCAHFEDEPGAFWDPMGRDFWADLPKTEEADEIVKMVEAFFGRDNVCILTLPIKSAGCMDGKVDWLRRHYPQFARQFIMGPAKRFCGGPGSVLVDDHTGNTEPFHTAGGAPLLVSRPWNHQWEREPHILEDLERALKDLKGTRA